MDFGLDLLDGLAIKPDAQRRGGLADALHRQLRDALLAGHLQSGSRLPSTRALALQLGVSRNTVLEVFSRLLAEDFLVCHGGSGTYVSDALPVRSSGNPSVFQPDRSLPWRGPSPPTMLSPREAAIDFRPGVPDLRRFPIDAWRRSSIHRLGTASHRLADDGPTQGDPNLRRYLAAYLATSRAAVCSPDAVLITSGAQQAFALLAQVVMSPSTVVAVEEPGYPPAAAVFAASGARIVPVPVDPEGLVVAKLPADAQVVYVTPSHQFPLGVTLSLRRRHELLAWARERAAWIIEDDYDSEFRFKGRRIESLQGIDHDACVIYVGTFSKILLPTFRMGYMVLPPPLLQPMLSAKWLMDRHTASLPQAVMADFMETGGFSRHLRRMQNSYQARFEELTQQLGRLDKETAYLVPSQAGLHATLMLSPEIDVPALIEAAHREGLGLHDLRPFCQQPFCNGLVLGFGNVELDDLKAGLNILIRLLKRAGGRAKSAA